MANIYTYVSGHTELGDISEFFSRKLLNEGERPLAFFDGVFYESHQERVGNIVYQDYLVYSDRAVYLWARGTTKDFLDRFPLGAVTINSRNKDSDFATMNLRIRREGKDPVFVIFDMVELQEAEKIATLHTVIETEIERSLGGEYRHELPPEVAMRVYESAASICPPRSVEISGGGGGQPSQPQAQGQQGAPIGYGQDLLEQYKTSRGYSQPQQEPAQQPGGVRPGGGWQGPSVPDPLKALEGSIPSDPESIKRIASNLKGLVGDAPFRLRDQVMKDLQHIPGDMATVMKAANELITNIADNPQAEKFVINAIQTAVRNDGIIGSVSKLMKLGSSFAPPQKKGKGAAGQTGEGSDAPQDDAPQIRRKKIRIQAEDQVSPPAAKEDDHPLPPIDAPEPPRKKVKIVTEQAPSMQLDDDLPEPPTKKVRIRSEEDEHHLESPALEEPIRKKVLIRSEDTPARGGNADAADKQQAAGEPDASISEDMLGEALKDVVIPADDSDTSGESEVQEKPADRIYKTLESDPARKPSKE